MKLRPFEELNLQEALAAITGNGAGSISFDDALLIADEFLVHRSASADEQQAVRKAIASRRLRQGASGLVYNSWLERARVAARSVLRPTLPETATCKHHLYVVLKAVQTGGTIVPGLYVGLTGLGPEKRFENHLAGIRSARTLQQTAVCLLPSFFSHLNPLPWALAADLEVVLANTMRAAAGPKHASRIQGPSVCS